MKAATRLDPRAVLSSEDTDAESLPLASLSSTELPKLKEKASPFTAGMNPTMLIQPTFGMLNGYFKCLHIV